MPPKPEVHPTVPVEGHVCDFPIWSYSKRRCSVTSLHIDYEDGSYFSLKAPEGMPSPSFPGYLDCILFYGQHDLFNRNYIEMSVYSIFKTLGLDATNGGIYEMFRRDMKRAVALYMETDRFRDPTTGERCYVDIFHVLQRVRLYKNRQGASIFYFDDLFLDSLRSGYLKRVDFDYCLHLDRDNKPLSRFLYSHILKRLGEKSIYLRNLVGFLYDVGLGYVAQLEPKRRNEALKDSVVPALDAIRGEACSHWQMDDKGNLVFFS